MWYRVYSESPILSWLRDHSVFSLHMVSEMMPRTDWWCGHSELATSLPAALLTWPGPPYSSVWYYRLGIIIIHLSHCLSLSHTLHNMHWETSKHYLVSNHNANIVSQSVSQSVSVITFLTVPSLLQLVVRPPSVITCNSNSSFSPLYLWSFLTIQMRYLQQNK